MDGWKLITGIILLVVGFAVFWQSYKTVSSCNSVLGKVSTFLTSIFGGTGAQACYNAGLGEVGGIIVAIIGLVVIFTSNSKPTKGRKK